MKMHGEEPHLERGLAARVPRGPGGISRPFDVRGGFGWFGTSTLSFRAYQGQ